MSTTLTTTSSRVAPTWYNAATYTANTASTVLCSGCNLLPSPSANPNPLNAGAYDYQKAQVNGFNYEIACHVVSGSGAGSAGLAGQSFEQCIAQCSAYNLANANSCLDVVWDSLNAHSCTIYTTSVLNPNYNPTLRSARLLSSSSTPPYPLINDQQYLLPNQTGYNIGICTGPGLSSYAGTRINSQGTNGVYQVSNGYMWNECGGSFYSGTTSLSVATMITGLNGVQSTYTYTTPVSADDCLRLCAYANLPPAGFTPPSGCGTYQWDNTNTCYLFSGASSTTAFNSSLLAAGRWAGSGFLATDTPAGYKLRARNTIGVSKVV